MSEERKPERPIQEGITAEQERMRDLLKRFEQAKEKGDKEALRAIKAEAVDFTDELMRGGEP